MAVCVYMTGGVLYDCGRITHYSGRFYVNGGFILTVLYHCGRLYISVGVFILMWAFLYDCGAFINFCGHLCGRFYIDFYFLWAFLY
jgi:hypothetical protein